MSAVKINIPLFDNKKKEKASQPDFNSTFEVEDRFKLEPGKKYQLAGWRKESKNGLEYTSLTLSEWVDFSANKEKPTKAVDTSSLGLEVEKTGHAGIDESEPF